MRMIHFIDPQSMEKNYDWHREVKESWELLRYTEKQSVSVSNAVWGRFKRRLLVFIRRERL